MVANSFCSSLAGATQRRLSRGRQTRHQGSQRASESHAAWGGDPVRAQNVEYSVEVEAAAKESEIQELIRYTDRVAEIPNSLRLGAEVKLEEGRSLNADQKRRRPSLDVSAEFPRDISQAQGSPLCVLCG